MRSSHMEHRAQPAAPPERVLAEAERWYARLLAGDCTADERAACERWQAADPRNAQAYAQVRRVAERAAAFRFQPQRRAAVRRIRERAARAGRRRAALRWGLPLGAAASAVLALGIGWQLWQPAQPERHHATATGERRTLELDDGSRVLLDTDSAVSVRYGRRQRDVLLERGQAEFTVAPAPRRPFVVHADGGAVRAVGTRFQVRRHADSVRVSLLEGAVTVTAPPAADAQRSTTLAPGEELRFDAGRLWARSRIDLEAAQGWTQGELVFRERPLPELIEEMNRYTQVKLRIGDESLNELRFSGVFYDNDQASLLQALEAVWSIRAEQAAPDEIILHPDQ